MIKNRLLYYLISGLTVIILAGCGGGGGGNAVGVSPKPTTNIPIVFVGDLGGVGMNSMKLYEYFSGMGFPEDNLFYAVLPRISSGSAAQSESTRQKYAQYTPAAGEAYDQTKWDAAGNTAYNVPYLKSFIDSVLTQTGALSVDIVCHSNGTFVVRKLLQNPLYAAKVRKAVFVSGYADVNGTDGITNTNWSYNYLNHTAISLPAGIQYYAIAGTADGYRQGVWKNPAYAFNIDMLFKTADVPGAVNYDLTGYDHSMTISKDDPVQKIYGWLTGNTAAVLTPKATVAIGGVLTDTNHNGTDNWQQVVIAGAIVTVDYYDITTGSVTQFNACSTTTDANGNWSCSNLDANKYFRVSYTVSGKTLRIYYADRITQNSKFNNSSYNVLSTLAGSNGEINVFVMSAAESFYKNAYYSKPATTLTGWISNDGGITKIVFDSSKTVTASSPLVTGTYITNREGLNTNFLTSSTYNFWQEVNGCTTSTSDLCTAQATSPTGNLNYFTGKTVTMEVTLNGTRTSRIQFPGNDASSVIYNWILFLY
jgi:hypothetical protein